MISRANGSTIMPDWFIADHVEKSCARFTAILGAASACGRKMKARRAALRVSEERHIDGHQNSFFINEEVVKPIRDKLVTSIADFCQHPKRRNLYAVARRAFRRSVEFEVREWMRPRWPQVLEEVKSQLTQEAVAREAVGENEESILADLPRRTRELAIELTHCFP
jgi:hypothetical protein